jgi:hypothetical protein
MKYKLTLPLIKHNAVKTYGKVEVHIHAFLTSVLDKAERFASCPGLLSKVQKASLLIIRMQESSQSRTESFEEDSSHFPLPEMNSQFLDRPVGSLVAAPNIEHGFLLTFKVSN